MPVSQAQDDPFERAAVAAEAAAEMFTQFNQREEQLYNGLICAFCANAFTIEELNDPDLTHVHVESWVTGVKKQSPVLRRQTGKRAHSECVRKIGDGEAPDQEPIPGLGE